MKKGPDGICDRCGFDYKLSELKFQHDYRGGFLVNTNLLVCKKCMDKPFTPNKFLRLPADPPPVKNPRPEMVLTGATIEIINGIPTPVGGTVVPASEA